MRRQPNGVTVTVACSMSRAGTHWLRGLRPFTGEPSGQVGTAPASVERVLSTPGTPLEPTLRSDMEQRFDQDFSHVRVHVGSQASAAANIVNARAFTVGRDIVFGTGQYAPEAIAGRKLLAHELAHVVQQTGLATPGCVQRLTAEEKQENLGSPVLKDDARLQQAFDNSPLLKKNETSEGVKTLQRALKELDYPLPLTFEKTGDADGIFGDETVDQVKQFQRDNQLSDDGIVGRDMLRALDAKFNPKVTIEKIFFGQDHGQLINNDANWSPAGPKYADWANAPYHIVFKPAELFGETIPIIVPAGHKIEAMAKVSVQGGIPGRTYSVRGSPMGQMPGWKLSGEGTHRQGFDMDYIFLSGEAPLSNAIAFQDFLMLWETETFASRTAGPMSDQKVFVTSGAATHTTETSGGDAPNSPTFRRLRQATRYAAGIPATNADRIVYEVFRGFPNYGVCDAPSGPNTYGITCPVLTSVWEMSDFQRNGNFQCIAIARHVNAVLNVLGVPNALQDISAKPVVIWADPESKELGKVDEYPHPGIDIPRIRHPRHPEWVLGLLDGNCGINNYEACIKLQWRPVGQSEPIIQYYCGGLGAHNPREGFKTARQVLDTAFVLAYHVRMARNDPRTGFPRGIRKEDVKVYDKNFGERCRNEL